MGIEVNYSGGKRVIEIGEEFFTRMGRKPGQYRIKALHGLEDHDGKRAICSYSPSGLGDTPVIGRENIRTGEIVDFCGDSVAMLLSHHDTMPDGWNEDEQTKINNAIYNIAERGGT